MFGAFRPTSTLSGGLLWYALLKHPSPTLLPHALTRCPLPLQENPLAPINRAKSAAAQTATHGRQGDRNGG